MSAEVPQRGTQTPAAELTAGSARSLLLTVLGELVWPGEQAVWTSSLLYVLRGLGVEEQTARQAIARVAAAGWIEGERSGREVRWRLTSSGIALIDAGSRRVTSMSRPAKPWAGEWLILLITIPHARRTARKKLYGGLRWAGFGNPTPGLWVSPFPERSVEAGRLIADLGLSGSTLSFVGRSGPLGLSDAELVSSAWDLEEVHKHAEAILASFGDAHPAPGDDMLFTHIRVVSAWQRLPFLDPQLPAELLPDWIGRRAASHLQQLRDRWSARVREHWSSIEAPDR